MKKRTYKRMKNRLYREIHRRMLLEHSLAFPPKVCVEQRKIETVSVRRDFPIQLIRDGNEDLVKQEMTHAIVQKICEDGYVVYYTHKNDAYLQVVDRFEVEARLAVVKSLVQEGAVTWE